MSPIVRDRGRGDVRDRLAHRHAPGRGPVDEGERRALADGHGLAEERPVAHRGDGAVGHRHLPRAHHLVARAHPAHGAVADGHEEGLVRDRRQPQHAVGRLAQIDGGDIEGGGRAGQPLHVAVHARRLAEEHLERHVDGVVREERVLDHEPAVHARDADHRVGAALALAEAVELVDPVLGNREHVALLRFVGPDLHGRHARLLDVHLAKLDVRADAAGMGQLGQRVRQPARAHVVDGEDRVRLSHLPAGVDDFLAAALEFRVGALHGIEVERLGVGAARHRGGRAAAHPDEEAGAAELHEDGLRVERLLRDVLRREVAQPAREHDGLVVAAHLARDVHLEGAEVPREVGPPELVVVGRAPDGALDHDRERRGDAPGLAVVAFPGLALAGEVAGSRRRIR